MRRLTPRERRAVDRACATFRDETSWCAPAPTLKFIYVAHDEPLNHKQIAALTDMHRVGWTAVTDHEYVLGHGEWRPD